MRRVMIVRILSCLMPYMAKLAKKYLTGNVFFYIAAAVLFATFARLHSSNTRLEQNIEHQANFIKQLEEQNMNLKDHLLAEKAAIKEYYETQKATELALQRATQDIRSSLKASNCSVNYLPTPVIEQLRNATAQ